MTNFLSRFIPNYTSVVKSLRDLTKQNVPWHWGKEQEDAFAQVKKILTHERNLSYFDTNKVIELHVDASTCKRRGMDQLLS
ncbi:Hypp6795 [Branchiostoma lanceolatum]|uniref:Hypp6795 protein n=1 Tax=Branchiostoma lanceolatum TaxID=7740 RepID=A0A8K0EAN4_BRALA|nr:Hypp6795 [Branchiostoma lanceolatum]